MVGFPSLPRTLTNGLGSALAATLGPLSKAPGPLGVLFSGGVDSAVLAWELRRRPGLLLCTVGRPESADLLSGRAGAGRLGLPWQGFVVGEKEVREGEKRFASELAAVTPVARTVLLSLALAIERAPPSRLVCGQGVDELFLGYAHYQGLDEPEAERRSLDDLTRLRTTDWPATRRIAETAGKELIAPFLSPEFEAAARRVPISLRLPGRLPKRFFREWALSLGLPPELALRPKKAVQYGSGVAALLRRRRPKRP